LLVVSFERDVSYITFGDSGSFCLTFFFHINTRLEKTSFYKSAKGWGFFGITQSWKFLGAKLNETTQTSIVAAKH